MKKSLIFCLLICIVQFVNGQRFIPEWCRTTRPSAPSPKMPLGRPATNARLIDPNGVIIIPVVFHVLHNNTAEDIAASKIQSQLDRLNIDFRKLNADVSQVPSVWSTLPTDIKVEFRLACLDPQGNATSGIVRRPTTVTQFTNPYDTRFTTTGGDDAWPTDTYLNIWVCDMEDAVNALGHATFPEQYNMTVNGLPGNLIDGITLDYTIVGDNNGHMTRNKGRVATHEAGHWLGLAHIFTNLGHCDDVNWEIIFRTRLRKVFLQ